MRQLCQCIRYMSSITRNSKARKISTLLQTFTNCRPTLDFDEGTESSFRISLQSNFAVDQFRYNFFDFSKIVEATEWHIFSLAIRFEISAVACKQNICMLSCRNIRDTISTENEYGIRRCILSSLLQCYEIQSLTRLTTTEKSVFRDILKDLSCPNGLVTNNNQFHLS